MHIPDRIIHTTAFVKPVVEHWLEREIAQWVHPMKDRSDNPLHHERMLLPGSYISLLSGLELRIRISAVFGVRVLFLLKYRGGSSDKSQGLWYCHCSGEGQTNIFQKIIFKTSILYEYLIIKIFNEFSFVIAILKM